MKHVKKFASILLALVMILSLAITAFADTDNGSGTTAKGSITVDNPQDGVTYTAYQIFEASYVAGVNGKATAISYTIKNTSQWWSTVLKYIGDGTNEAKADTNTGVYASKGITLTPAAGVSGTYVVTTGTTGTGDDAVTFSAADFVAYLKSNTSGKNGKVLSEVIIEDETKAKVADLEYGYYLVVGTYEENSETKTEALANLTTTTPDVTIHDKNDVPFEKVADDVSVEVGQIVNFTITGNVPDTTGFTDYTYKITDTMSAGLDFNKDVKVVIKGVGANGADLELKTTDPDPKIGINYKVDPVNNDPAPDFELTIKVADLQAYVMKEIEVTYTAIVNENAVTKVDTNTAILEYTNDPNGDTDTQEVKTKTYSAKIVIDKYKTGDDSTKLSDAKFVLYKDEVSGEGDNTTTTRKYYYYDEANNKVQWNALGNGETLESVLAVANQKKITVRTTDANGAANFSGLEDGTYYLLETEAPTGYNLLTKPVTVTINPEDVINDEDSTSVERKLTMTSKVANNTGSTLPGTGGMGTTLFYIIGGVLLAIAAVLLITRKRMSVEK